MNALIHVKFENVTRNIRRLLAVAALLSLAPLAAHAQTGIAVGYTGLHDGQRGRVLV